MRDRKIKVLRIIARLNIGGPAIHTILLTHYLRGDVETQLAVGSVSRGEQDMDYLLERLDVTPVYIHTLKRELSLWGDIKSVYTVYKMIGRFKPDIIHTHTAKAGAIGRAAGILYNLLHLRSGSRRIKLVHTFHGHVFHDYFNRLVTSVFVLIERALALFTDRIVAVSDALRRELVEDYGIAPDSKIKAVYNGYELGPFLSVPRERPAPSGDRELVITTVGRLVPVKGHRFLIAAFARVGIPARLVIVGDGILRNELTDLARRLGVAPRVDFTGYKRDILPAYTGTDVFVLGSLNEGAPVAVIEALACARPVIATDVGGVGDLLGGKEQRVCEHVYLCERGILVPPADDRAIADSIEYLAHNPEIGYRIGIRGREFVRRVFTIDRLRKDMMLLYAEVLEP